MRKYSENDRNAWLSDFADGMIVKHICEKYKIDRGTLYSALHTSGICAAKKAYDESRFWDNLTEISSGCIEFVATRNYAGYGVVVVNRKHWLAHRFSYLIHFGKPGKYHVCHKCDNPACVNPDHLFLGTDKDNHIDKATKGRAGRKLTKEQVLEIRGFCAEGLTSKVIANKYGVHHGTVSKIRQRNSWKYINDA